MAFSLLLLAGLSASAAAQTSFTWGVEWGYTATMLNSHSFNYHSTDGVRVDDTDSGFDYKSNGLVLLNLGAYIGNHFCATINTGYAGIYEMRDVFPLSLRATYFVRNYKDGGFKFMADAGTAFPLQGSFNDKGIYMFKAGTGYRMPIYDKFGLDLTFALQYSMDHPHEFIDKYTHEIVPASDIRRSDRNYLALNISLALCF